MELAGGQLVDTQGQRIVWTGHQVMVEPDPGPGDGVRPGPEGRQGLRGPRWAPALMPYRCSVSSVGPPTYAAPCAGRAALP